MKQVGRIARLPWNRAVLVVGALLCLCVSDSAGPRLLPLPTLNVPLAVNQCTLNSGTGLSGTHNRETGPNAYIEMVVGSQYRGRDRHQQVTPTTHAPLASLQLKPGNLKSAPETYPPLNFQTPPLSIAQVRGPPRFA